jgi:hypothetical protein
MRDLRCRYLPVGAVLVVLLVATVPASGGDDGPGEWVVTIEEVTGRSEGPAGGLTFTLQYNADGSLLLLVGRTGPSDLCIVDRDLEPIADLELPPGGFQVAGARWAANTDSVIVWGRSGTGTRDDIAVYRPPSYERNTTFVPRELVTMDTITSAHLIAGEQVCAVAGVDENDSCRLVVVETRLKEEISGNPVMVLCDHRFDEGVGVSHLQYDSRWLLVFDDGGGLDAFSTEDWTLEEHHRVIDGPPSSVWVREDFVWVVGGERGRVVAIDRRFFQWDDFRTGHGTVQAGCAMHFDGFMHYAVAVPDGTGGSHVRVLETVNGEEPAVAIEFRTDSPVTTLECDPQHNDTFSLGCTDGTIATYIVHGEFDPGDTEEYTPWIPVWAQFTLGFIMWGALFLGVWYVYRRRRGRADGDGGA